MAIALQQVTTLGAEIHGATPTHKLKRGHAPDSGGHAPGEPTDGLALLAIESMEVDGAARMVFLLGSDDLEAAPAVPRATARTLEPGTLELTIQGIRQNTSGTLPSIDEEGLRVGDATVVELGTLHSFDAANIDDDQAVRFLLYTSDASARFSLSTSTAPYAIVLDVRGEH